MFIIGFNSVKRFRNENCLRAHLDRFRISNGIGNAGKLVAKVNRWRGPRIWKRLLKHTDERDLFSTLTDSRNIMLSNAEAKTKSLVNLDLSCADRHSRMSILCPCPFVLHHLWYAIKSKLFIYGIYYVGVRMCRALRICVSHEMVFHNVWKRINFAGKIIMRRIKKAISLFCSRIHIIKKKKH